MTEVLDREVVQFDPGLIVAPCVSYHPDHRALHDIAIAVARPHRYAGSLMFYQAGFEKQDDGPCVYVDITQTASVKYQAMLCYWSQIESHSVDPLAIEAVDRVNGIRCGHPSAEVFVPHRLVW